jgi:hypothetical protein
LSNGKADPDGGVEPGGASYLGEATKADEAAADQIRTSKYEADVRVGLLIALGAAVFIICMAYVVLAAVIGDVDRWERVEGALDKVLAVFTGFLGLGVGYYFSRK